MKKCANGIPLIMIKNRSGARNVVGQREGSYHLCSCFTVFKHLLKHIAYILLSADGRSVAVTSQISAGPGADSGRKVTELEVDLQSKYLLQGLAMADISLIWPCVLCNSIFASRRSICSDVPWILGKAL